MENVRLGCMCINLSLPVSYLRSGEAMRIRELFPPLLEEKGVEGGEVRMTKSDFLAQPAPVLEIDGINESADNYASYHRPAHSVDAETGIIGQEEG